MKALSRLALGVFALLAADPSAVRAQKAPENLPPHPRLLFNRAGLEAFKAKMATEPWRRAWTKSLASLDKDLARPLELPPRGGNWSHNYVCPEHGARLSLGKAIGPWQWEHRCPVGPHVLRGDPSQAVLDFDGNGIMGVHGSLAGEARDMGLAWAVTGEPRYAERARAIVLAYAERYLTYARHDNHGKPVKKAGSGGRVASQSLTEAGWLTALMHGADLVWDTLSAEQRATVERKLIRPALDETVRNPSTNPCVHNIQCHRNSAVGLAGFLLGDRALIDEAIDGRHGYRANMAGGVQADGAWFEGAWGYHFYTLDGLWPLTEAARNVGIDLYGPELRRMFEAPLRLATPTLRLPAFNDSGEVDLAGRADSYELAFARYGDPAFAALPAASRRSGSLARWFGAGTVAGNVVAAAGSRNAEASGYAILQKGAGTNATWVCVKYGPHGGGHGHYDKNNAVVFAGGRWLMPDAGTHAYGSPLHKSWDKTTFAHNTVVVDGKSQAEATGKCLAFGSAGAVDYVMTDAGAVHPGVRHVRTVAMAGADAVVFVDHVAADAPRTLDLVCHVAGAWRSLPEGSAFDGPPAPGYQHLRDATTRTSGAGFALEVAGAGASSARLVLAAGAPTGAITGTGVGKSTADRVPVAVFRRVARETAFVWAVSVFGAPVDLASTPAADGGTRVTVKSGGRTWRFRSDPASGAVSVPAD
ncbi:MAG: alginate lyase family protein [Lentisphaerae bacterium]|nr:alginate lyase family protein [Lentisphaerota bacterium]